MKILRYLIIVNLCVALLDLSNASHRNLESPPLIIKDDVYGEDELPADTKNKYSKEDIYTNSNLAINHSDESHFQNAINNFLDETNSGKNPSNDKRYQRGSTDSSEFLAKGAENVSSAYAKLIEMFSYDSAKPSGIKGGLNINGHYNKTNKKKKSHIRIKSTKNLNDRESIQIKKFHTEKIKKKNINFMETSADDLLSSDLMGTGYVMENNFENAFENHVGNKAKQNSPVSTAAIAGKSVKKPKGGNDASHVAFIEKNKEHHNSSHNKKDEKKQTHRANNSESHKRGKHQNNFNKKHAQHKKKGDNYKSNEAQKHESKLQTRSKIYNAQEDNDDREEGYRNAEHVEHGAHNISSDEHSSKRKHAESSTSLHNRKDKHARNSSSNDDDDDYDDDNDEDYNDDDSYNDDNNDDSEDNNDNDDDNEDYNDNDEEEEGNLMLKHERDTIKKYSKVYKLNLFNCSFINDWDFAHQYIDEKGSLIKLSGYVFQNLQDTDAMPTSNTGDWKLKGACDFSKYVCGALNFMSNQYNKGERVIFEGRVYEALMNTELSPEDDGSSWVEKTSDCKENLTDN